MFEDLLQKIGIALDRKAIPYMIIGGQAVLLYGEPRLTRDIDITLGASPDQLDVILSIVREVGLKPLVDPEDFTRKTMVLPCQDRASDIRVDFIFSFSVYERQALKRIRIVDLGGVKVKFSSLEDLVIHKIIAGRPRDLEDVKNLLLKNTNRDEAYIRHWLKDFSGALGEPFDQRFEELLRSID